MTVSRQVASSQELDGPSVGNALHGLRWLGDSPEVRNLIAALTPKVC